MRQRPLAILYTYVCNKLSYQSDKLLQSDKIDRIPQIPFNLISEKNSVSKHKYIIELQINKFSYHNSYNFFFY